MFNKEFLESHDIIPAFMPVDLSADVNTGDRVNLQNYDRCLFVLLASIGTAGDDPVITAQQHTAAAIEVMSNDLDSDNGFTFVSFNVADVGANAQLGAGFYILQGAGYVNEIQQSSIA